MGSHAVLGISAAFWTLAALYSLLLHRLTSYTTPVWWYLVVYACAAAMGYFIHYTGHQRWWARWYRAHDVEHHINLYPPTRFLRDQDLGADDGNAKFYAPLMIAPFFVTLKLYGLFSAIVVFVFIASTLLVVDYFHSMYHLKGCWLENYAWFQELRRVHVLHHAGNRKVNYCIVDFTSDVVFGTFAS